MKGPHTPCNIFWNPLFSFPLHLYLMSSLVLLQSTFTPESPPLRSKNSVRVRSGVAGWGAGSNQQAEAESSLASRGKEKQGNIHSAIIFISSYTRRGTALPKEHILAANDQAINISRLEVLCAN